MPACGARENSAEIGRTRRAGERLALRPRLRTGRLGGARARGRAGRRGGGKDGGSPSPAVARAARRGGARLREGRTPGIVVGLTGCSPRSSRDAWPCPGAARVRWGGDWWRAGAAWLGGAARLELRARGTRRGGLAWPVGPCGSVSVDLPREPEPDLGDKYQTP